MTVFPRVRTAAKAAFRRGLAGGCQRGESTVGRVHPHVEVKIIDPDTGRVVPRGTPGELCTRGYSVMTGYWNDPERTAEAIDRAEWMHTGDVSVMP